MQSQTIEWENNYYDSLIILQCLYYFALSIIPPNFAAKDIFVKEPKASHAITFTCVVIHYSETWNLNLFPAIRFNFEEDYGVKKKSQ